MQGAQINVPASITSSLYGANSSGKSSGFLPSNLYAGNMEFAVATNAVPIGGGVLNMSAGLTYPYKKCCIWCRWTIYLSGYSRSLFYNIQLTAHNYYTALGMVRLVGLQLSVQ